VFVEGEIPKVAIMRPTTEFLTGLANRARGFQKLYLNQFKGNLRSQPKHPRGDSIDTGLVVLRLYRLKRTPILAELLDKTIGS
jgi:hypothetical protein